MSVASLMSIEIWKIWLISVLALFWFVFTSCIYEHQRLAFCFHAPSSKHDLSKLWQFPATVSGFGWAFHPVFITKNWQIAAIPCAHPMQLDGSFFQSTTLETFVSRFFFSRKHWSAKSLQPQKIHAGVLRHYLRLGSCFTLEGALGGGPPRPQPFPLLSAPF